MYFTAVSTGGIGFILMYIALVLMVLVLLFFGFKWLLKYLVRTVVREVREELERDKQ